MIRSQQYTANIERVYYILRTTCAGVNMLNCGETIISVIFQCIKQSILYFLLQLLVVMCSVYRRFHNCIKICLLVGVIYLNFFCFSVILEWQKFCELVVHLSRSQRTESNAIAIYFAFRDKKRRTDGYDVLDGSSWHDQRHFLVSLN